MRMQIGHPKVLLRGKLPTWSVPPSDSDAVVLYVSIRLYVLARMRGRVRVLCEAGLRPLSVIHIVAVNIITEIVAVVIVVVIAVLRLTATVSR